MSTSSSYMMDNDSDKKMSAATVEVVERNTALPLQRPTVQISFGSGHVTKEETLLTIQCHDRFFRDAEVFNEDGDKLFTLTGKELFTSWTLRRTLADASGEAILDVRHTKTSVKDWVVEDSQSKELCTVQDGTNSQNFTDIHARVPTKAGKAAVSMRSFDHGGSTTAFEVEGVTIAVMHLIENNDMQLLHRKGLDRTAWKLRIAGEVDMALVLALAFCRIEIRYVVITRWSTRDSNRL